MSHYTVLVIGEDPEKQLEPFDEAIEVAPYDRPCYCMEDGKPKETCQWCGGTGTVKSTYNPKSKWDWYSLGGRWLGMLKLKPGASGLTGRPGVFHNEAPSPEFVDQARIQDIDWKGMEEQARNQRAVNWDEAFREFENDPESREFSYGIRKGESREEYLARGRYTFSTYAVLMNGEWHEKGEMGWFGMASNEMSDEEWQQRFDELLAGLPGDTLISVYDCHI